MWKCWFRTVNQMQQKYFNTCFYQIYLLNFLTSTVLGAKNIIYNVQYRNCIKQFASSLISRRTSCCWVRLSWRVFWIRQAWTGEQQRRLPARVLISETVAIKQITGRNTWCDGNNRESGINTCDIKPERLRAEDDYRLQPSTQNCLLHLCRDVCYLLSSDRTGHH